MSAAVESACIISGGCAPRTFEFITMPRHTTGFGPPGISPGTSFRVSCGGGGCGGVLVGGGGGGALVVDSSRRKRSALNITTMTLRKSTLVWQHRVWRRLRLGKNATEVWWARAHSSSSGSSQKTSSMQIITN